MNSFTLLPREIRHQIFSYLSEVEIANLQTVCHDFYHFSADNALWNDQLENMHVKLKLASTKTQVQNLYFFYTFCLKEYFEIQLPLSTTIFEAKKLINVHIAKDTGPYYHKIKAVFDWAIEDKRYFFIPLLLPHVNSEWKDYVLTKATKKAACLIPHLIKMGAIPNETSFPEAIKTCPEHIPAMLTTGFKLTNAHLSSALFHQNLNVVKIFLNSGLSPCLQSLSMAAKYLPVFVEPISKLLEEKGFEKEQIKKAIEKGSLQRRL